MVSSLTDFEQKLLLSQIGKTCESLGSVEPPRVLDESESPERVMEHVLSYLQGVLKVKEAGSKKSLIDDYNFEVKDILRSLERAQSGDHFEAMMTTRARQLCSEVTSNSRGLGAGLQDRPLTQEEDRLAAILGDALRCDEQLVVNRQNSEATRDNDFTHTFSNQREASKESKLVSFLVKDIPFREEIDDLECCDEVLPPRRYLTSSNVKGSDRNPFNRNYQDNTHSQQLSSLSSVTHER